MVVVVEVVVVVAVAVVAVAARHLQQPLQLLLLGPRHLCGQELVQPLQPRDEHVVVRALEPQRAPRVGGAVVQPVVTAGEGGVSAGARGGWRVACGPSRVQASGVT